MMLALALATLALADPTVYTGTHNAQGNLILTINGDGTRVIGYKIPQATGDTCEFTGAGDVGVWEGAAIAADGTFSYQLDDLIKLEGRFAGPTATGILRLRRHAGDTYPACDTGNVAWTAAAPGVAPPPVPPPPTPPVNENSTPPTGTTQPPAAKRRTVLTSVVLRRHSAKELNGRLSSPERACRTKRRVSLKRGALILGKTTTKADGTFRFRRSPKTRGRMVRVVVSTSTLPSATCASVTSKPIKG
jgi:hypothetical protein